MLNIIAGLHTQIITIMLRVLGKFIIKGGSYIEEQSERIFCNTCVVV